MTTRELTFLLFGAAFTGVLVLDQLARRGGVAVPTLGELLGFVMQTWIGRAIALGFWAWTGYHFFAR